MKIYFELIFITFFIFLIIRIIGKIFSTQIKNFQSSLFIDCVIGFFVIVFFASTYFTKGKTVFVLPLVVSLILAFVNRKYLTLNFSFKFELENFTKTLPILLITVSLYFFHLYDFEHHQLLVTYPDDVFYGRISQILMKTGIEANRGLNEYFPMQGCTPWHYGEMWFSGFFAVIFKANPVLLFTICTYAIGNLLVVTGLHELFFGKQFTIKLLFVCFFLTTIIGVNFVEKYFGDYLFVVQNISVWSSDVFTLPKLFCVYIVFITIVILFKQKAFNIIPYLLFLSGICFFTLVPAIVLISLIFFIYFKCFFKKNEWSLLISIGLCVLIFVFYYIYGNSNLNSDVSILELLKNRPIETIKSMIFTAVSNPFELFISYFFFIPFIVLFLYIKRNEIKIKDKNTQIGIILFFVILFIGIFSGIMFFQFDAWQILSNFAVPIINISLAYIIFFVFNYRYDSKKIKRVVQILVIIVFGFTYYYREYFNYFSQTNRIVALNKIDNDLLKSGLKLYWGNHYSLDTTYRNSVIANGVHSPISHLASINSNIWTLNIKFLFFTQKWQKLYPFETLSFQSREEVLNYLEKKYGNILYCDKNLKNEVPLQVKKRFKLLIL